MRERKCWGRDRGRKGRREGRVCEMVSVTENFRATSTGSVAHFVSFMTLLLINVSHGARGGDYSDERDA